MIPALILLVTATVFPPQTAHAPANLKTQIEKIVRAAHGRVGAAVTLLETGESSSFHGDQHFPMQSVYKFPIGMAVLHEVDAGRLSLNQKVRVEKGDLLPRNYGSPIRDQHPNGGVEFTLRELLRFMVVDSDGTASDVLLRLAGGPKAVTAYLQELGVKEIVVATPEMEMARDEQVQYRNWAAPSGAVALLKLFQEGRGLSSACRELLMQWMTETGTGPNRIKGLLPPGTVVAHKTGTSGRDHGLSRATNDVGLIALPDGRHLAVAVFVSDSTSSNAINEAVIAEIARAAWDSFAQSSR